MYITSRRWSLQKSWLGRDNGEDEMRLAMLELDWLKNWVLTGSWGRWQFSAELAWCCGGWRWVIVREKRLSEGEGKERWEKTRREERGKRVKNDKMNLCFEILNL